MTRRTLFLATLGVALVAFLGAAWLAARPGEPAQAQPVIERADALVRAHSPVLGPEDAPVTVVEFFDPACEACRAFHPVVKEILERHPEDVRVVLRYTPFHGEASELAIKALEAARLQGVFEPVLEALLERQREWASHDAPAAERILEIAAEAGLDAELARQQVLSPEIVGVLNQDRADVEAVGVRQTPTFFVDGKPLAEFGADQLTALVDAAVEASRAGG